MGCIESKFETSTKPKGVSVFWLNSGFLSEVQKYGKTIDAKIYEIENLGSTSNGLIRQKGQDVICPRDDKLGAAYVDCLEGVDHVGTANVMLSYGWGNSVGEIVLTLWEYCQSKDLDPKRVYVWVCCLCNNQHRVVENQKEGKVVPFEEFEEIFREKVVGIDNVVALMSPWNKPIYLSRVWCVFEFFTANMHNCTLTIAMPPSEKVAMMEVVNQADGMSKLYDVFASTEVEAAQASQEEDRKRILKMIETPIGPGFDQFNNQVNNFLREWVKQTIMNVLQQKEAMSHDPSIDIDLAFMCNQVGHTLNQQGEYDQAVALFQKSLDITRKALGDNDPNCAAICNNIGHALTNMGWFDNGLEFHVKALDLLQGASAAETGVETIDNNKYHNINEKDDGNNNDSNQNDNQMEIAQTIMSIGATYYYKEDYNNALTYYKQALQQIQILESHQDGLESASAYDNIASVYKIQEKYNDASAYYLKAISIREKILGFMHPDLALSYNNYGSLMSDNGDQDEAMVYFNKTLQIELKVLGKDHYNTAITYNNMGLAMDRKKAHQDAINYYKKSLDIKLKTLDKNHPSVVTSYCGLGGSLAYLGEHDDALTYYEKAMDAQKKIGQEDPVLFNNMAYTLMQKEDYKRALEYFENAYRIWLVSLGSSHVNTENVKQAIEVVKAKISRNECSGDEKGEGPFPAILKGKR